ncbi:MAG: metal-dependent hydrolase [Bacteroidota bacterium]
MASIFGHALAAASIGSLNPPKEQRLKFYLLGIFCAAFPDADVLAFSFDIPYESLWGHRGITHSISFSLIFGIIITKLFYRKEALGSKKGIFLILYFSMCTLSHAILDAMTTGGLGVAFLAPFENSRYFLPWREIQVSPIGASKFFSEWGIRVIKSELIWIGIPSLLIFLLGFIRRKLKERSSSKEQ